MNNTEEEFPQVVMCPVTRGGYEPPLPPNNPNPPSEGMMPHRKPRQGDGTEVQDRFQRKSKNARIRSIWARVDAARAADDWSGGSPEDEINRRRLERWEQRLKSKGFKQ